MKFEYELSKDNRECVAYIDPIGDLIIKDADGMSICFVCGGVPSGSYDWEPERATRKFYPGDKVTITF